jgi:hypothetical protein
MPMTVTASAIESTAVATNASRPSAIDRTGFVLIASITEPKRAGASAMSKTPKRKSSACFAAPPTTSSTKLSIVRPVSSSS